MKDDRERFLIRCVWLDRVVSPQYFSIGVFHNPEEKIESFELGRDGAYSFGDKAEATAKMMALDESDLMVTRHELVSTITHEILGWVSKHAGRSVLSR
jgi:hypothetical protein